MPWLPVIFQTLVSFVVPSVMISSREPVVAPYMWYQKENIVLNPLKRKDSDIKSITVEKNLNVLDSSEVFKKLKEPGNTHCSDKPS